MLWGKFAQSKGKLINKKKHCVLTCGHPSTYSEKYFFGCKHFSKCNEYLKKHSIEPINWLL